VAGVPSRAEYLAGWSALHGGYDPAASRLVDGWLTLTYVLARPLAAARVPPDLVTVLGGGVAAGAVALAALGGRWAAVAAAVVVVSGVVDNLDGAVAVLTGRASRWGSVLDSAVDRVADCCFVATFWVLGAPGGLVVAGGALMGLHEYVRARALAAGMSDVGTITVWERPTRVITTAMFLLGCGIHTGDAATWATAGAAAWIGLGVVGLGQLLVVVRRRLSVP
jgi:CDP-diacylglycerol--glycerol-3-phosphate 3-phosphatidyltransferase